MREQWITGCGASRGGPHLLRMERARLPCEPLTYHLGSFIHENRRFCCLQPAVSVDVLTDAGPDLSSAACRPATHSGGSQRTVEKVRDALVSTLTASLHAERRMPNGSKERQNEHAERGVATKAKHTPQSMHGPLSSANAAQSWSAARSVWRELSVAEASNDPQARALRKHCADKRHRRCDAELVLCSASAARASPHYGVRARSSCESLADTRPGRHNSLLGSRVQAPCARTLP